MQKVPLDENSIDPGFIANAGFELWPENNMLRSIFTLMKYEYICKFDNPQ